MRLYRRALIAVILLCGCVLFACSAPASEASSPLPLQKVRDVVLNGAPSRFNYQNYDSEHHLLFITNPGAKSVVVFNVDSERVVGTIGNLPGVRGVLAIPALNRVYATARSTNRIVVIDENSLKIVGEIPGGNGLASLAYAPAAQRIFVSLAHGDGDLVIDAHTNRVRSRVALGSKAGYSAYDPATGEILITAESRNELAAVDPRTSRVVARYALPGCSGAHAIAIDAQKHKAFVACEDNAKLADVDLDKRHVTEIDSVGKNVDVIDFDPGLQRLYVSSESGVVSVFDTRAGLRKLGQAYFAPDAHTVEVDPQTHRVYFPLQDLGGRKVLRIMKPVS